MIQLAILPGPNTPEVIDSFLEPIVSELNDLSKYGLMVRKNGIEVCNARVHLVIASGDIPAAAALARHTGHTSKFGCRICRVRTEKVDGYTCYLEFNAPIREKTDFTNPDLNIEKVSLI